MISNYISQHYDQIKQELLNNGVHETEIEQEIKQIELKIQKETFNEFKEELRNKVLGRVEQEQNNVVKGFEKT